MYRTTERFWQGYHSLPQEIRLRADKAFALLRSNPHHPSLQFKQIGALWAARIDLVHRALPHASLCRSIRQSP